MFMTYTLPRKRQITGPGLNIMSNIKTSKVLIIDYGSQYTQLIARRVRELNVYCEIYAWDVSSKFIEQFAPTAIILSGGPESVHQVNAPSLSPAVLKLNVPVLGVCYGMQLLISSYEGVVSASDNKEFGYASVRVSENSVLLSGIIEEGALDVWMSHGDQVTELPDVFVGTAASADCPYAAVEHKSLPIFGVQFHPEVEHTSHGRSILGRFLYQISHCDRLWKTTHIIDAQIESIRQQVGDKQVLLGLSGGVDSSVVAALLNKAVGKQLICVFVDTGLLRYQEGDQVMQSMAEKMDIQVIRVNASNRYYEALKGVFDPEKKRKIIGELFVRIFEEEATKLQSVEWLAQGTIYPDVIESAGSATGKAHVIKSHHNVGGLPENLSLKLIEPLRDLFKDEVRKLGVKLGLHKDLVYRHPFPGPGLGVRILGEVQEKYVDILARADHIFIEELRKHQLYDQVSQAFAVFIPVKSVGVVGDARRYEYVVALRAVETIDFMTARWAHLPYEFIDLVSRRIINEIEQISRVVYDVSGKPPATIEWE